MQREPVAHGGAPPQVQLPLLQESPVGQAVQAEPLRPHSLGSGEKSQPPSLRQQPVQVVESQTQVPPSQMLPLAQSAPLVPHEHDPPWQRSARPAFQPVRQLLQPAPPMPHSVVEGLPTQLLPLQHPEQLVQPAQTPLEQPPPSQPKHWMPLLPQALSLGIVMQRWVVGSQQPVQDEELHWQLFPEQI